jgi:hypothetical protein
MFVVCATIILQYFIRPALFIAFYANVTTNSFLVLSNKMAYNREKIISIVGKLCRLKMQSVSFFHKICKSVLSFWRVTNLSFWRVTNSSDGGLSAGCVFVDLRFL